MPIPLLPILGTVSAHLGRRLLASTAGQAIKRFAGSRLGKGLGWTGAASSFIPSTKKPPSVTKSFGSKQNYSQHLSSMSQNKGSYGYGSSPSYNSPKTYGQSQNQGSFGGQ